MLFNYDSMPSYGLVVTAILVGGLFTYTFYNIFTTTQSIQGKDSLINTTAQQIILDSINELPESNYPILESNNLHKIDVGVQTSDIHVAGVADAGVQATNIHVNTGIQTSARMWYETVKNWITELLSINSSEIQGVTPTEVRVETWLDNLNTIQNTPSVDVNSVVSVSDLQGVDSVSNNLSEHENMLIRICKITRYYRYWF